MAGQAAALASGYVAPPGFIVDETGAQTGITANPLKTTGTASAPAGSTSIATGQVTVGTSATPIVAARAGRISVIIIADGVTDVFVGGTGVTLTTGALLPGVKGSAMTLDTQAAVSGIVATGTQVISFIELF